jgi:2-oxoglutarate dehydrogenase E2 component (dihydrolipoamide succinyltransferase)
MNIEILVPVLGESVSEATIAKWHKKVGETVKVDELLLELETEKVTLEVNATAAGVLSVLKRAEGETVQVGELVGLIDSEGVATQTSAGDKAQSSNIPQALPTSAATDQVMPPSVQKIVKENDLNPSLIQGTGRDGRLTKADALSAVNDGGQRPLQNNDAVQGAPAEKREERIKMSRLRKTIAQRLKDSQNTAAILTTFNEIDMTNVMALRNKYKEEFEKKHGV